MCDGNIYRLAGSLACIVGIGRMNIAQIFMLLQVFTCALGAIGFLAVNKPWEAGVWAFYSAANICWFAMAARA